MVFKNKAEDRNSRTGKPTLNNRQAIEEGYQDFLDEKEDEKEAVASNNIEGEISPTREIPRGQGVVSTEPFGDQAGTNDWDGGADEEPKQIPNNDSNASQQMDNSPQKSSTKEVVPEFYKVQDKTGRVKFTAGSIEALANLYEELTGPNGGDKLTRLSPMERDLLEMSMKIKDGQYKSIDGLAADIALCANIISEDPKDLKKNFESISNALGVTSDSQKRLFDLSTYNSRSLNNVVLPNESKEDSKFYQVGSIKFPAKNIYRLIENIGKAIKDESELQGTNPSYRVKEYLGDIWNIASDIKEGKYKNDKKMLLRAFRHVIGSAEGQNQKDVNLESLCSDDCFGIDMEELKAVEGTGKNEPELGGKVTDIKEEIRGSALEALKYFESIQKEPEGETTKGISDTLREGVTSQAESNITNKTIDPYDVEILEKQIEKFKEIQTTGRLSKAELDTFIDLTKLKEKGWKNVVYGDLPSSILSLTRYSDKSPNRNGINIAALERKINEYKKIQRESALTPEQLEDFIKLASLKEKGWENVSISELPEGSLTSAVSPEPESGKKLSTVAIAAAEAVRSIRERATALGTELREPVKKLEGIGERTLKKADESLARKGVKIPEGSSATPGKTINGGGSELLKSVVSGSPVKGFIGKMKGWWNKKWNAPHESGLVSSSSEVFNAKTTIGLVILALLGVNKPKVETPTRTQTTITQQLDKGEASGITVVQSQEVTKKEVIPETIITPEMIQACQRGNNSYLINCIKAVAGSQGTSLRTELVTIIGEAAKNRAESEGKVWSKLNADERNAYADAVLGGDSNSPSGKIAKKLGLDKKSYTFTGIDDLRRQGIKVPLPERPKYIPIEMVILEIRAMKK
jgi:hypothetical protein